MLVVILANTHTGSTGEQKKAMRKRADQLLVEKGHFESRALAQAAIAAGLVMANGKLVTKASQGLDEETELRAERPFETVSRAGLKLKAALDAAHINPSGWICVDLGASTGGFCDLLLQRGAGRVYAVDVGHGQLHARLKDDPKLVNLEGTDARAVNDTLIPERADLITADLSFIGLAKALPAGLARLKPGGRLVALVKPQFEAGPNAGKRGIIRDAALHAAILARVRGDVEALGIHIDMVLPSPIEGGDGNREFLLIGTRHDD